MALGPKDITLTEVELGIVSRWEEVIDILLLPEGGQEKVSVRLEANNHNLPHLNRRIEKELQSRYLKAGWGTVQFGIGTPGILMQVSWKPE